RGARRGDRRRGRTGGGSGCLVSRRRAGACAGRGAGHHLGSRPARRAGGRSRSRVLVAGGRRQGLAPARRALTVRGPRGLPERRVAPPISPRVLSTFGTSVTLVTWRGLKTVARVRP